MFPHGLARMSSRSLAATQRARAIAQHMMASTQASITPSNGSAGPGEAPVLFETRGSIRKYILNRPQKLNALDTTMLNILRPYVEEWSRSNQNSILVGTGVGRAFCAGGDVAGVVQDASDPATRPEAISFFQREFELDFLLAALPRPYVAIMDGYTMGGGVGLSAHAPFRIATENTAFAMPETKIGYCPDVGASYFLSRVDGEIGTYLGLTGDVIRGREVFELGFATHFIPSRRIPSLLERLASLDDPTYKMIDRTIEECSEARNADDPAPSLAGPQRVAVDTAFAHNQVEKILESLKGMIESHENSAIRTWAQVTLDALELRSPTSLKVALAAIRKGKTINLQEALQMELNIATAYCSGASPDFHTGVTAVLVDKIIERPAWYPATLGEVSDSEISKKFFSDYTPTSGTSPALAFPEALDPAKGTRFSPVLFALPTEQEIRQLVDGSHASSGATAITLQELLNKLNLLRQGKMGIREKVLEVVERCCVQDEEKETGEKYLRWKSSAAH